MTAFALAYPILPFFLDDVYHVTDQRTRDMYIALFGVAGNMGFFIFSPIWGRYSDIYGRRPMMIRANLCCALLVPLMAFMPGPIWLVILRFINGALAGVVSAATTLVSDETPAKYRGMALGSVSSVIFCGNLFGLVAGGWSAGEYGYNNTFIAAGVLLILAALLVIWGVKEKPRPPREITVERPVKIYKRRLPALGMLKYILVLTMIMGVVQTMDGQYIPVLISNMLKEHPESFPDFFHESMPEAESPQLMVPTSLPEETPTISSSITSHNKEAMMWNSLLGGVCALAGMIGGVCIGALSDRYRGYIIGVLAMAAGGLLVIPQAFCDTIHGLFIWRTAMIFCVSGLSPILQSWLTGYTNDGNRGTFFGYATSARAMGWMAGGVVSIAVTWLFGTTAIFIAAGIILFLMIPLTFFTQYKLPFPIVRDNASEANCDK